MEKVKYIAPANNTTIVELIHRSKMLHELSKKKNGVELDLLNAAADELLIAVEHIKQCNNKAIQILDRIQLYSSGRATDYYSKPNPVMQ